MNVTLIVMTDGRMDCLARTLTTLNRLHGPITRRVLHDDTGDEAHRDVLRSEYPAWHVIGPVERAGFAGAYRHAWAWLRDHDTNPLIASTEDDFRVTRDVDLTAMARVLTRHTYLTQLALRRQPWNPLEAAYGGIVESRSGEYTDRKDGPDEWLEHRLFHTTNPSLMRRDFITAHDWPDGPHSEGRFGVDVFAADPDARAGFWGARSSGEWVHHIGDERRGHGY